MYVRRHFRFLKWETFNIAALVMVMELGEVVAVTPGNLLFAFLLEFFFL